MSIFKGSGVAIVTPFHEDLSVDYEKLDELIDFQCNGGTDAIIICGTTGESATLTEEEHSKVIKFAVERAKKRVPVIAGTGSNATHTAVKLSEDAVRDGVDGLLQVTPYYNKATQKGLIAHFAAVANAVSGTPIVLYNVASRTGVNIEPKTIAKMFKDVPNIVAVKEASGNISQVAKIMELTDGKIDLYSGNDDQIIPLLALGGKGVISVLANIAPKETHDICSLFFEGKLEEARKLQLKAIPLIEALFCEVNPIPVKKAMTYVGKAAGPLRLPLTEISKDHEVMLIKAMYDFGLIKGNMLDVVKEFFKLNNIQF
ncbi:MAG: 4-hydroxy-tetrahydrodipicolinate synthase [Lachnospiraceae bacterium]|jgi:4-hydroxy-tetrahydrodipicolinate synthase|nr:4-hydroxy-tetrahydrodipicolinate synthase [Lachnospiraceae bacterium]